MSDPFKQPPHTKALIESGYCRDYNETPELAAAYGALKESDPGGYLLLADFDRQQARRDWVHERRTGPGLDSETYTPHEPLSHWFGKDDHSQCLLAIANLLAKGYTQAEVAEEQGVSESTLSRKVEQIRNIMGDKPL